MVYAFVIKIHKIYMFILNAQLLQSQEFLQGSKEKEPDFVFKGSKEDLPFCI